MGAMTIVEIVDQNGGFNWVRGVMKSKGKRTLLWRIAFLTFFLSAILDKVKWLASQWGTSGTTGIEAPHKSDMSQTTHIYDLQGREVKTVTQSGMYIYKQGRHVWKKFHICNVGHTTYSHP